MKNIFYALLAMAFLLACERKKSEGASEPAPPAAESPGADQAEKPSRPADEEAEPSPPAQTAPEKPPRGETPASSVQAVCDCGGEPLRRTGVNYGVALAAVMRACEGHVQNCAEEEPAN